MRVSRLLVLALLPLAGCHSAYIDATVKNTTKMPLTLVEVDYPSASFGTQTLLPGQDYHYRLKVLGSGALKLIYTDSTHTERTSGGPSLKEGDEGSLTITVSPSAIQWDPKLKPRA